MQKLLILLLKSILLVEMRYAIFTENRLIAICDTLPKAISSMPQDCDDTHIFNEDREEIIFFKKGKPNGELENKK
jgi:hypothetical protein